MRIRSAIISALIMLFFGRIFAQDVQAIPPAGSERYAVQLSSSENLYQAEQQLQEYTAAGPDFLWIENRNGRYCVLFGPFERGAEVQIWKEAFRKRPTTKDAFMVVVPASACPELGPALPTIFNTNGTTAAEMPLASMSGIRKYEELEALDVAGKEGQYREALRLALQNSSSGDPIRGYALANLGILQIKSGKSYYFAAHRDLQVVADGRVPASASVRVMAMVRATWLLHQLGYRERALCGWKEIQSFTLNEAVRARCQAEEIGILLELAESGKGTHEEVRMAASIAYADMSPQQPKWRAVVELIFAETYARQPNPNAKTAALLCEKFVEKYSLLNEDGILDREVATASYQAGLFHEQAGEIDAALEWYQKVFAEIPPDVDHFAGLEPHAEALGGVARIVHKSGDQTMQMDLLREILVEYPNSILASIIAERRPSLTSEINTTKEGSEE